MRAAEAIAAVAICAAGYVVFGPVGLVTAALATAWAAGGAIAAAAEGVAAIAAAVAQATLWTALWVALRAATRWDSRAARGAAAAAECAREAAWKAVDVVLAARAAAAEAAARARVRAAAAGWWAPRGPWALAYECAGAPGGHARVEPAAPGPGPARAARVAAAVYDSGCAHRASWEAARRVAGLAEEDFEWLVVPCDAAGARSGAAQAARPPREGARSDAATFEVVLGPRLPRPGRLRASAS